MSLILSIESATVPGSVAVHEDGKLISLIETRKDRMHSSRLGMMVEQAMKLNGFEFTDLAAVAVSEGPGSYTGLRIGGSIAKGIAFSADLPLIAVNTLSIIASAGKWLGHEHVIVPLIDARRMEVYAATYDADLTILKETRPLIIDEHSFSEELSSGGVLFCGDGAKKASGVIKSGHAIFRPDVIPSAAFMGGLANHDFLKGSFVNVTDWEPNYVKAFQAGKPKSLL